MGSALPPAPICTSCNVTTIHGTWGGLRRLIGPGYRLGARRTIVDSFVCPVCGLVLSVAREPGLFADGNADEG